MLVFLRLIFLCLFTPPTPEITQSWMKWFKSVEGKAADMGNMLGQGIGITKKDTKKLPMGLDAITGYMVFNAENIKVNIFERIDA